MGYDDYAYDYPVSSTPGDTTILAVIAVFLSWTTLYFSLEVFHPSRSAEWHCRLVTVIHATTVVSMSSYCGFVQGPWPFSHPGGPNTELQHWTVTVSFAYFIFDICWCMYFKTEGAIMLFHHLLSLFGQFLCLYRGRYGTEMIATIFGTEMTNPLLQLRWFLRESQLHKTWYAELNDLAFMVVFGVFRIGLASYLLYTYMLHPGPDWIGKLGGFLIYLVGWVFWIFIVRYAIRKYTKMYKEYKKGAEPSENGRGLSEKGEELTENGRGLSEIGEEPIVNGQDVNEKGEGLGKSRRGLVVKRAGKGEGLIRNGRSLGHLSENNVKVLKKSSSDVELVGNGLYRRR